MPPSSVESRTVLPFPAVQHPPAPETAGDSLWGKGELLRSLVHHATSIQHDASLEQVRELFADRDVEFLALVRDELVTGLCSRSRLGRLLGSRYGFALYGRSAAQMAQVERPLVFPVATPVRDILARAFERNADEFREDVVLVDENGALIGLIPIDALVRLQTRIMDEQFGQLRRQHAELLAVHQARRQSQGRYAGLFDSHALGVALLDQCGVVQTYNRRLAEQLDLDRIATTFTSLTAWLAEPERADVLTMLQVQAAGGAPASRELTLHVPGRSARLFRCSLGWIAETSQVCACFDDITEQRQMERRLARQEKQALLDTMVGGIAHELNNKLTPVRGFSELIGMTAQVPIRHYAGMISKSVDEAARIIQQLLQLSRPTTMLARVVDLREVVREAMSMMRFQVRESRCTVRPAYGAEPAWVHVDAAEIKQVVMNLVLNALHAMRNRSDGLLDLVITVTGGRARLVVADNGVGIPAENIDRVFDPFFTTKGPEQGTGLGLSVCFSIVRQHGGEITVDSAPDAGARFTVTLPFACAMPEPAAAEELATETPSSSGAVSDDARVLVVEDEPRVRRLIRDVLTSRFGCDVDTVATGIQALERLADHRYVFVLSDVRMAEMNGTELYLWLREAQPDTASRFAFITGYPGESHLQAEVAEWDIPVLSKPFTVEQLCELCSPYLAPRAEMVLEA